MTLRDDPLAIEPAAVARFRAELHALTRGVADDGSFGLAVSGGGDSLALLLLAHAACPGRVAAATVDHGLRSEARDEAAFVATLCRTLHVPHTTLTLAARDAAILRDRGNRQATARDLRFGSLRAWCREAGLPWLLTAHHADDQAETLLMRLSRGAGVSGLAGVRRLLAYSRKGGEPQGVLAADALNVARPLLDFTKAELAAICRGAGVSPVSDPSNDDPRYDRTRARRLLAAADWLDPRAVVASASHLADAEAALDWAVAEETARRRQPGAARIFDMDGLPKEIARRIVTAAIHEADGVAGRELPKAPPRGPEVERLMAAVAAGEVATLGRCQVRRAGRFWHFTPAPPHRSPGRSR